MPRRNHSGRVNISSGQPAGIGYADEPGRRPQPRDQDREDRWDGGVDRNRAREMVSGRPFTTLLTGFGLGFGLGLVVTMLITRDDDNWFERHAPDALRNLPDQFDRARHRLSSSLPGSFKEVGESLAARVPSSWKHW